MIRSAAKDPSTSDSVRKEAQKYINDAKEALRMKTDVEGTETSIREARKNRLTAVSDEAIGDVQEMTARLIQLRSNESASK